jgi:peptide deformylase
LIRAVGLPGPLARCSLFFSDAGHLEVLAPPGLHVRAVTPYPIVLAVGPLFEHRLRVKAIPLLRGGSERVRCVGASRGSVDEQRSRPYRFWRHERTFSEQVWGTSVEDHVEWGCRAVNQRIRCWYKRIWGRVSITGGRSSWRFSSNTRSAEDPRPRDEREECIVRLKIVQVGEPVLREVARTLTVREITSDEIQRLIADMKETMRDAPGVGLAAPQVGLSLQLAVIEDKKEYLKGLETAELQEREREPVPFQVIVNPRITFPSDEAIEFYEGCLSLAGFSAIVGRVRTVRVECLDENGAPKLIEATGWYARILQHEIDHLNGNLYIDRMRGRTFTSLDNFTRFWKGKAISEITQGTSSRS